MSPRIGSAATSFVSWNVKGLNHPVKRSKVFSHLKKLKGDIVYLQETHLCPKDHSRLNRDGFSQIFHSTFQSKSRGAAILIRKNVQFVQTNVITDNNGRFVIVQGHLYNTPVILACVYAPNWDNTNFFKNFLSVLPDLNSHQLILSGDWNCVLHSSLDRSAVTSRPLTNSARTINSFIEDYGLVDPWRFKNPLTKAFSFFSPAHQSYSRIDYFLLDKKLLNILNSIVYESIVISDHSPVVMSLCFPDCVHTHRTWRLNTSLLSDEEFIKFVSTNIDVFLKVNMGSDTSLGTIWEALKAYLRGQIISYAASVKRERTKRVEEIIKTIGDIDEKNAVAPSADLYKERIALQTEFDSLSSAYIQSLYLKSRMTHYEHGERAGKLLCHQLRQSASNSIIAEVRDSTGNTTSDQMAINNQFKSFYEELYSATATDNSNSVEFFQSIQLPKLSAEDTSSLEGDISEAEINQAIKSMKVGKAPGPDGFPIEFYKAFYKQLSPMLRKVYAEALQLGSLPPTMSQAVISVLLKDGRDPAMCDSYRPISLVCCDNKILAKVLALRLEKVLPNIIHPDQTGFVKGRQSFENLRRLYNIIYSDSGPAPEAVLSLDAFKAFDCILFNYLFTALQEFGFNSNFVSWIKVLYSAPQAAVRTNSVISEYFPLQRGTRQGCPLSPLLFDLAIEPLAVALRQREDFRGIERGGLTHKLSLFADDLLLYCSDPLTSVPVALDVIHSFGKVSGYKINLTKSILFPINAGASLLPLRQIPFQVATDSFTYLGVLVTRKFTDLYKKNLQPALGKAKDDMKRWEGLPISLAGRINSVKMVIMPRLLYFFNTVPTFIPKSFFKELNKHISSFIWNKKIPRIRRSLLEKSKSEGGLALPNFIHYYWAANIQKVAFWASSFPDGEGPNWCLMERRACGSADAVSLVCSPLPLSVKLHSNNPVVTSTLRIWKQFRVHFGFKKAILNMPILRNPFFKPALMDTAFHIWFQRGLKSVADLFHDSVFVSFDFLVQKYGIPRSHFFRYLQIRDFTHKQFPSFPSSPPDSPVNVCISLDPSRPGCVSKLYNIIQSISSPSLSHVREAWESELQIDITDTEWQAAVDRVHKSSLCIRHGLLQFKVLHRLHFCRNKLAKIFPDTDPTCQRCLSAPATLTHMFFTCPSIAPFWSSIFDSISSMCGQKITLNPLTAIFGVVPEEFSISNSHSQAIAFALLLARRLILLKWKDRSPPSHGQWVKEVMMHLKLEELRFRIRGSTKKYKKVWQPFLKHFSAIPSANLMD